MTNLNTYKDTQYSKSVDHYFYDGQIRKAQIQFAAIFSELQVKIGKNDFKSDTDLMTVPVKIGSTDRVVSSIMAGNTQNKPIRLPVIATNLMGIEPAWDFVKGSGQQSRNTSFPVGGTLPDDGTVTYKYMPFPYNLTMEASIMASNEYQHQQMLEQILLLFNPDLQIQISDGYNDWNKISTVRLESVGLETAYPSETERRVIVTTLTFGVLAYLSPPFNLRDNYIKKIKLRIAQLSTGANFEDFRIEDVPGQPDEYHTVASVDGIPKA